MTWQPIETAPKDEKGPNRGFILLCTWTNADDYPTSINIGFWSDGAYGDAPEPFWANWETDFETEAEWEQLNPTHWMPLPEPPQGDKQ